MQCVFADGRYVIQYYRDLISIYDPMAKSVKGIIRKVKDTSLFKMMKENPVRYFGSHVDYVSDEVLALIVEFLGESQLYEMYKGSRVYNLYYDYIWYSNERMLVDNDEVIVFHTSNKDIRETLYGFLYCTMDYHQAIEMWSSRSYRKVCNYVNVFKVSPYENLEFYNGDKWECRHGGRLLIKVDYLKPIEFIDKISFASKYKNFGEKYKYMNQVRNRIIHVLNPLIATNDLADVCFYWVNKYYGAIPFNNLTDFIKFMKSNDALDGIDNIVNNPEKWKSKMLEEMESK